MLSCGVVDELAQSILGKLIKKHFQIAALYLGCRHQTNILLILTNELVPRGLQVNRFLPCRASLARASYYNSLVIFVVYKCVYIWYWFALWGKWIFPRGQRALPCAANGFALFGQGVPECSVIGFFVVISCHEDSFIFELFQCSTNLLFAHVRKQL